MQIGSLTSAARTALSAVDNAFRQVDDVANRVAAGIQTDFESSTPEFSAALAELPVLKNHVGANMKVLDTAETLLNELASLPRR